MSAPPPDWEEVADRYACPAVETGDPTGWFDRFYAAGVTGEITMPWGRTDPHPLLADWVEKQPAPAGQAVVVGCGLGADAEYLARRDYPTTAFDAAPTAIEQCRRRYPDSRVDYRVADLFDLPADWERTFDLVVEIVTVQALPTELHPAAIDAVRSLVGSGGRLLVIGWCAEPDDPPEPPPWPLTRAEVESFGQDGLRAVAIETLPGVDPRTRRWRAEFSRSS